MVGKRRDTAEFDIRELAEIGTDGAFQFAVENTDDDLEKAGDGNGEEHAENTAEIRTEKDDENDQERMKVRGLGENERLNEDVLDQIGEHEYEDDVEIGDVRCAGDEGDEERCEHAHDRPCIGNKV